MENLFAHDPFREGKVEETLFDASAVVLGKATSSFSGPGGVTRAATRKTSSARRTVPCSHPPFMFTTNTMASGKTSAMETQISSRNYLSNSSTL